MIYIIPSFFILTIDIIDDYEYITNIMARMNQYISGNNVSVDISACLYSEIINWNIESLYAPFGRVYVPSTSGGDIIFNGKKYHLKPMHPIIIPPYTDFSSRQSNNFSKFYCHFQLKSHISFTPGVYEFQLPEHIIDVFNELKKYPDQADSSFILGTTMLECISIGINFILPHRQHYHKISKRNEAIIKLMKANIRNPLTNQEIGSRFKLAENSLVRDFKNDIGVPPQKYYMQIRLEYACKLLIEKEMSLEEISEECGFWDRNHFTRFFKKQWLCPPAEFRRRNRTIV